jgi:hypothetical protein
MGWGVMRRTVLGIKGIACKEPEVVGLLERFLMYPKSFDKPSGVVLSVPYGVLYQLMDDCYSYGYRAAEAELLAHLENRGE